VHVNVTCTAHQIYLEICNILEINSEHLHLTFNIQPFTCRFSVVVRTLLNLNDHCKTLLSQSEKDLFLMGHSVDHSLNTVTDIHGDTRVLYCEVVRIEVHLTLLILVPSGM
jgi:hypothetical protein